MDQTSFYVHPTAEVSPEAHVGAGTRVWRQAQIREHAQIGDTFFTIPSLHEGREASPLRIRYRASIIWSATVCVMIYSSDRVHDFKRPLLVRREIRDTCRP